MDNQQLSTLILDALDDHAALLTADGTIVQVNLAWRRFAQANGDCDLHTTGPGVNYLEVCRRAAQTGDALAHAVFAGLQAVLTGQQASFQLEYPCHTPLEPRRFTLRAVPLAPNDRRVLVTHRPITVYKEAMIADAALIVLFAQAETWLRLQSAALEATATPVAIIDHTGMIKWVNPAYTQMTGYLASEVLGQNPRLLKSGLHPQTFYTHLWDTILTGQVWRGELTNRRKDGQLYDEEQTITPVRNEAGQIAHFIAIKQDITQRKQWEYEQLARTTLSTTLNAATTRTELLTIMLQRTCDMFADARVGFAIAIIRAGVLIIEQAEGLWRSATGQRLDDLDIPLAETLLFNRPYFRAVDGPHAYVGQTLFSSQTALACVPLSVSGEPFGVLLVGRPQPFRAAEQHLLIAVAEITSNALYRATLYEATAHHLAQMQALHRIDKAISAGVDVDIVLNIALDEMLAQLAVDAIAVFRMHHTLLTLECVAVRGFVHSRSAQPIRLGEGYVGQIALSRGLIALADLTTVANSTHGLPVDERFVSYYGVPLIAKGHVKGVLELFTRAPLHSTPDWRSTLEMFASQLAIALDNADMVERLQRSHIELMHAYETTIEGWSRALDLRDHETEGHSLRVTAMTLSLARAMGVADDELIHIRRGALLHDIGKMGVPDQILLKPGPLTDDEWGTMRRHPVAAYEMLAPITFLEPALTIPYGHHERYDGSGYPRGLVGEQIPLAARLFAVVDVWDALRSDRPYRTRWPEEQVRAYLQAHAGTLFDPRVVAQFLQVLADDKRG